MTIVKLQTVGKILKARREEKKFTIEEVADEIRIKEEYLRALENDDYQKLPSQPFTQGFIKNYARLLGLKPEILLALFRRDFKGSTARKILPEGLIEPPKNFSWSWTPRMTMIITVIGVLVLVGFYLFWQYRSLMEAPYFTP